MTTQGEQTGKGPEKQEQQKVSVEANVTDQALESEAVAIEGRVGEVAKTSVGEDGGTGGKKDDGSAKQAKDDAAKDDKAALKAKLLKKAPPEKKMRKQVEKKLLRRKSNLESKVRKYRRKRNYHLLGLAVMQLRMVIRQLEELAKASYDKLKDMWLKVVHRIA